MKSLHIPMGVRRVLFRTLNTDSFKQAFEVPFTTISKKKLFQDLLRLFPVASSPKSASLSFPTSVSYYQFIFDAAAKFCVDIATHQHGCCVMNQCIDKSVGKYQEKLVAEIVANGLLLAQDAFGKVKSYYY
ncbi:uncharacterized protein LOC114296103 [Camellia sinensis]|uniref:uncharacterized protein LOC114296103 n=1 Tax=Camellia sinensis TaxID=4442 RepID=UPI001036BCE9|nr:uncharacterized protein LOC114296103 [Camellia sinensis]